jgi:hypothetical protein
MSKLDQDDRGTRSPGKQYRLSPGSARSHWKMRRHVRNAIARFSRVEGVTDHERR